MVVNDRTDGAGLEKVLSSPRLESTPPPAVRLVPANELAPRLGALMERDPSRSVDTVPTRLLRPMVGVAWSSLDMRDDWATLVLLPDGAVEKVQALVSFVAPFPTCPDSGYGLFFFGLRLILCRLGRSASEEDLKLVSFLTHVEKGRRRGP